MAIHAQTGIDEDDKNPKKCISVYCIMQSTRPASRARTYIGMAHKDPWYRLEQHNGVHTGGVKRLENGRPWELVCFVHGFRSEQHALVFEHAWQKGGNAWELRHVAHGSLTKSGIRGRAQVLASLLVSRKWYGIGLGVHTDIQCANRHVICDALHAHGYRNTSEGVHGSLPQSQF